MDFKLTDGQEMLKKTVREFAEKVVGPRAEEVDQTGIFPRDTFEQMAKLGLMESGLRKNTAEAEAMTLIR